MGEAVIVGVSVTQLVTVLTIVFAAWAGIVLWAVRSMLQSQQESMDKRFDALVQVDQSYGAEIEELSGKVGQLEREIERTSESRRLSDAMFKKLFEKVDAIARDLNQVIGELRVSRRGPADER